MRRPNLVDLPDLPTIAQRMVLRSSRVGDEEALASLLRTAFVDDEWTPERVRRDLTETPDVIKTFIVEHEVDGIIATASARLLPDTYPGSGYVHWVAASPEYGGKKLGYIVSLAVLHEFVSNDCNDAVLETDDGRLPAIKTYLNLGFQPEYTESEMQQRWDSIYSVLHIK